MKQIYHLSVCAAIVLLASCAKEQAFEPTATVTDLIPLIPLNIDGSISQVATKASASGFVDKDAVGLYAVNYTDGNTVAGTLAAEGNQADNVKYVFDESAYKWTPVHSVYYKDINTNVDLYVYYPFQSSISDVNAYNFEVRKDQSAVANGSGLSGYEASDWLWGKAEGITPSESKVQVPLNHRLSAVQVTLLEGTGFEEGEFDALSRSVIVTNTTRKAILDFAAGTATPLGDPQTEGIVMCPQADGSFRAVVIPQTVSAGTQLFAITLNGISYSFKQSNDVTYQVGKQLSVSITLKKKNPSGEYELSLAKSLIVDWSEDLNSHGGEARQYFVVNVETPGTLEEVITAMGKNPAKIRNLKITGTVTDADFYFMRDNMDILEAVNMKEANVLDYTICASAFKNKKSLVHFVFPEYLETIGDYAFQDSNLSGNLILPEGIVTINQYAFSSTQIARVSFPSTLKAIGQYAFASNSSLTGSLLLPVSLISIGKYAFHNTHFAGNFILPEGLEELGAGAFYSSGSFIGDYY